MNTMTPPWLQSAMTSTCQVMARQEAGIDPYGNPVYINVLAGTYPCLLAVNNSAEIQHGRTGVAAFTLYLPAESASVVDEFCYFLVDGGIYEVDGPPQQFSPLFNASIHHVEVALIKSSA